MSHVFRSIGIFLKVSVVWGEPKPRILRTACQLDAPCDWHCFAEISYHHGIMDGDDIIGNGGPFDAIDANADLVVFADGDTDTVLTNELVLHVVDGRCRRA